MTDPIAATKPIKRIVRSKRDEEQVSLAATKFGDLAKRLLEKKDENNKKRRRPDLTEKKKKNQAETVIKCMLFNLLRGNKEQKIAAQRAILKRVVSYSQRLRMGSIALATMIKEAADGKNDVTEIALPDFINQTFFRQLMLGEARKDIPAVNDLFKRRPELLLDIPRCAGDSNIYCFGAKSYLTNLKNHFKMNFIPKIKNFCRQYADIHKLKEPQMKKLLHSITGWNMPPNLVNVQLPNHAIQEVVRHRKILMLESAVEELSEKWIDTDSNCYTILRYFIYLNRFRSANGLKLFSIIPITHSRCHSISIDTDAVKGVISDLEMKEKDKTKMWQLLLDTTSLLTKKSQEEGKVFTGTINTDGISVCIHYYKLKMVAIGTKKKIASKYDPKTDSDKRMIGIDPGRNPNILVAVEQMANGSYKQWRLTRKQYYKESGITKAQENIEKWQWPMKPILLELASASHKGVDLEAHNHFIAMYLKHYNAIWSEYTKLRWASQRMSLYGGKKRALHRFFEQIKQFDPNRDVVVAYGAAKFAPGGKGEINVPTSSVFKECSRYFKTVPTDEFRTTIVYHKDGSILKQVRSKYSKKTLHDLLWFESTSSESRSKFVSRDFNAAINILHCLVSRPASLTRQPGLPTIIKQIGKTVKC